MTWNSRLDIPGGSTIEFPGGSPDPVVIAACLAASGQLHPIPNAKTEVLDDGAGPASGDELAEEI